ncbi:hypothetical protein U3A55_09490 [Salarchaeum sp. III]|uniref:hypothetical protein n=1 Tax=Salarchaeum sp. III TaxID=3107927 RepID=UPI002ED9267F
MQEYIQTNLESSATTEEMDTVVGVGDDCEISEDSDDEDETDERPDDCMCDELRAETGLGCWPCYREGFETVASE